MDIVASASCCCSCWPCWLIVPGLMPDCRRSRSAHLRGAQTLRVMLLVTRLAGRPRGCASGGRLRAPGRRRGPGRLIRADGLFRRAATPLNAGTPSDLAWIVRSWSLVGAATAPASSEAARSEPEVTLRLPHLTFASLTVILIVRLRGTRGVSMGARPMDSAIS